MKHLFQIKEQNRMLGNSKVQDLEEELRIAHETINRLQSSQSAELEEELKDTKGKLRIMTTKFANVRKERDAIKKENQSLQNEVLELQSKMRQMVPGFQNISSSFPILTELADMTSQFYKCDCEDLFFEVLGPELSLEGVVYFFRSSFPRVSELIKQYFAPAEDSLKKVTMVDSLEGPIMNVLRKSYQGNWKGLMQHCVGHSSLQKILDDLQRVLQLGGGSASTNAQLMTYLKSLGKILFAYYIHDPPIRCGWDCIGQLVEFNSLHHDALDGFIRPGDQCYLILPPTYKSSGEIMNKAAVLSKDYEMDM